MQTEVIIFIKVGDVASNEEFTTDKDRRKNCPRLKLLKNEALSKETNIQ